MTCIDRQYFCSEKKLFLINFDRSVEKLFMSNDTIHLKHRFFSMNLNGGLYNLGMHCQHHVETYQCFLWRNKGQKCLI